jgi:UDP-glucose 4-epimerase
MRYVVTGGSGYLGALLTGRLAQAADTERVLVADVRPPFGFAPKVDSSHLDVRDAGSVRLLLERERADAVIHLAAILEADDPGAMYEINVAGTNNVLEAAAALGTQQVMTVSTTAVYGSREGDGAPLTEDAPQRAPEDFDYARHAATADRICELWSARHPERVMTIVRPCAVLGPRADNFMTRLWTQEPHHARFADPADPVQFVHEDDLIEAMVLLLEGRRGGVFNVAGREALTIGECQRMAGLTGRRGVYSKLRARKAPDATRFLSRPALVDTRNLEERTGWSAAHTCREAFETVMRAHGRLSAVPEPAAAGAGSNLE